jgi:hypothetical protein
MQAAWSWQERVSPVCRSFQSAFSYSTYFFLGLARLSVTLARIRIAPGSLFSIYYSGSIGGITYFRFQSLRLFDSASFHTRRVKSIFSDCQVPGFVPTGPQIYLFVGLSLSYAGKSTNFMS